MSSKIYETREKEYTHHTSELELDTGETRTVEWDSMKTKDDRVVFKRYTGYSPDKKSETKSSSSGTVSLSPNIILNTPGGFTSEAFLMVPLERVVWFETTDRTKRTIEYEVEVDEGE